MKAIDLIARRIRFRVQARQPAWDPRRYRRASDELLEYAAFHGMRSLCHLFIYLAGNKPCLSIVGNFDAPPGAFTTNLIEAVATAISERIGGDPFRLIEWYPHAFGGSRFSEVRLEPAPPSTEPQGEIFITPHNGHQGKGHTSPSSNTRTTRPLPAFQIPPGGR